MINETEYTNNPLTKEQENQIDALFAQYDNTNTPGCAVGVIQDGRFIYKKSFGMANLDYDIPITADSKFYISSTSKQFTAACIVLLSLEGKLKLDDDVRKFITELPDYGVIITVRHLLHHTSGIKDYHQLRAFAGVRFDNYYNTADGIKLVCRQKSLNFLPGDKYQYCNSGYLLLTEIISRLTGKSFREYANEKIFQPLGMYNTFFSDNSTEVIKNRVISYWFENDKHNVFLQNFEALGAGGLISTVNDLMKWNENYLHLKIGGKEFIELMLTKGVLNSGETIPYCLGLFKEEYKGLKNINHGGGMFGFRSSFVRFVDHNIGIIILCNLSDAQPDSLANGIVDIVITSENNSQQGITQVNKVEPNFLELSEYELEKFCGYYWCDDSKLARRIYLKDGYLFYWRSEESESKLVPLGVNVLAMLNNTSVTMVFDFADDKKWFNFVEINQKSLRFDEYSQVQISPEYLQKYTGVYYCCELDVVYNLEIESDNFLLFIKDCKISSLDPVMHDLFKISDWGAYLSFNYNDKNEIAGFKIDSDRAQNIKFIKQT